VTRRELEAMTKTELLDRARAADVPGRSRMNKPALIDALADGEAAQDDSPTDEPASKDTAARDGRLMASAELEALDDRDFDISFRQVGSGEATEPPGSRRSGRQRRAALNARLSEFFDHDRRCDWSSLEGHPCGLPALRDDPGCVLHSDELDYNVILPIGGHLGFDTWPALFRHLWLASYDADPIGLDPIVAEVTWYLVNFLYFDYFKVEVEGIEHVPLDGAAILASNHGGAFLPYDGLMLTAAVANEAAIPRRLRVTATEVFNIIPFLAPWFRKAGGLYAARDDVHHALTSGALVGVFPEGEKGFMKPVWDAYEVQRFGRGGFVSIAEDAGVPIVPVAIVGAEEVHPAVSVSSRLAKLVQLFLPDQRVDQIAVVLNPIPLPVRWKIRFHPPVDPQHPGQAPDPLEMLEVAEGVRITIQDSLNDMLESRKHRF
jgi:1-acyl-sn-glycerol-3-phosphate acyltransferase